MVGAVLWLGACGAFPSSAPPNVATYQSEGSGMDALMSGTLRITDACVTVEGEGGAVTIPTFPRGQVALGADGLEFNGHTYADGDPIELGGGEGPAGDRSGVPEGCPDVRTWVVAPS